MSNLILPGGMTQEAAKLLREFPSNPIILGNTCLHPGRSLYDDYAIAALTAMISNAGSNIENYKKERLREMCVSAWKFALWMMVNRQDMMAFLAENAKAMKEEKVQEAVNE